MKAPKKTRIPDDIRQLIAVGGAFLVIGLLVVGIKTIQKATAPSNKEYAVERHSFEENLNAAIEELMLKKDKDHTELYEGTGNQVIDTAWKITSPQARKAYSTLANRRLSILSSDKDHEGKARDAKATEAELIEIETMMDDILRRHRVFYGWRIRHRCLLKMEPHEIIIDADTTGTQIKEVYADRNNFRACPDSALLQDILKRKITGIKR